MSLEDVLALRDELVQALPDKTVVMVESHEVPPRTPDGSETQNGPETLEISDP
jgi:hypothetical protein